MEIVTTSILTAELIGEVRSQLQGSGYWSAKVTSGNELTSTHTRAAAALSNCEFFFRKSFYKVVIDGKYHKSNATQLVSFINCVHAINVEVST